MDDIIHCGNAKEWLEMRNEFENEGYKIEFLPDLCIKVIGGLKRAKKESAYEINERVAGIVCDNLCKYRETCDDNAECDYVREHGRCPLDELI